VCLNNFFEIKSGNYRAVRKIAIKYLKMPDKTKPSTPMVSRVLRINTSSYIAHAPKDELECGTYIIEEYRLKIE
jgi:hypothetical protein